MSLHLWLAFCAATLLTSISPGPGVMATMNASFTHGTKGSLRLIAGLEAALLLQLVVVALGMGTVFFASRQTFEFLRYGGAAYLIFLGLQQIYAIWHVKAGQPLKKPPSRNLFLSGILVNLSNPKAILFQAALLPHFLDMSRPLVGQYLILALSMCMIDSLIMAVYAALSTRLSFWFESVRMIRWRYGFFGAVFVSFGLALLKA